jgi:hypothetical protein
VVGVTAIDSAVAASALILAFSCAVHQTSPIGMGGSPVSGISLTSGRPNISTPDMVGWTMRPRATRDISS